LIEFGIASILTLCRYESPMVMPGSLILKNLVLFFMACGLAGVCIFLGSVIGHSLGTIGVFSGAIVGGIAGIAIAVWLTVRLGVLEQRNSRVTFVGGIVGFIIAAVIAVTNLQNPLIPMASVAFIGLGALIGKTLGHKREV
jgi:hypothetical protein